MTPFRSALLDLAAWQGEDDFQAVVVGGIAAGILGKPRVTKDIDAVVLATSEDIGPLLESARRHGFAPRIDDPEDFARETGVLLLRHEGTDIDLDLSLGMLPFEEEMVARARWIDIPGFRLRVAAPEELLVMKALAGRPTDIADIQGLLDSNLEIDLIRVKRNLAELADLLDAPEIVEGFEAILRRRWGTN